MGDVPGCSSKRDKVDKQCKVGFLVDMPYVIEGLIKKCSLGVLE